MGKLRSGGRLSFLLRRPVSKPNFRRLGLRIDDRLAFGVDKHRLGPDVHIAALQGFASQLDELLSVLGGHRT